LNMPFDDRPTALKLLRRARNLKLVDIANQLGVSKVTLWGWETGRSKPQGRNLRALSRLYGMTEAEILLTLQPAPVELTGMSVQDFPLAKEGIPGRVQEIADTVEQAKVMIGVVTGLAPSRIKITLEY
jgi:transcriptional regulator with XRE-family HTH domain